jgi:hypothetical protein
VFPHRVRRALPGEAYSEVVPTDTAAPWPRVWQRTERRRDGVRGYPLSAAQHDQVHRESRQYGLTPNTRVWKASGELRWWGADATRHEPHSRRPERHVWREWSEIRRAVGRRYEAPRLLDTASPARRMPRRRARLTSARTILHATVGGQPWHGAVRLEEGSPAGTCGG